MSQKNVGETSNVANNTSYLDDEGRVILEPVVIIATKERRLHSRTLKEYLIRWKNFLDEDTSWETEQFRQQYPSLPLL